MCQGGKPDTGKLHSSYIGMNVCGSTYENGCVVNSVCVTTVADCVSLLLLEHVNYMLLQCVF